MSIVFAFDSNLVPGEQSLGSLLGVVGTLTIAGSYTTGGEIITASGASQSFDKLLKKIGMGRVLAVWVARGCGADWDQPNLKLKFWASPGVELAAAAYPAGMTASPIQCLIVGR
jgi:hypothetical protein